MDFKIYSKKDFQGTDYVEIGPGKYSGKHWQLGFVFVNEDDFFVAEGAIYKQLPAYDHYGMNDVSKPIGLAIVHDWRVIAQLLSSSSRPVWEVIGLNQETDVSKRWLDKEREKITRMLSELAETCERFCTEASGFCVLGL